MAEIDSDVNSFDFRYLAARLVDEGRMTHAAVVLSLDSRKRVRSQITLVVSGELEDKMVDAREMAKGLAEHGHIALYGIFFDTDRAQVKEESKPTLEQILQLLKDQPRLQLILVGHTDNQGSYDYNMNLSLTRELSASFSNPA